MNILNAQTMAALFLVGRILFGGYFIISGLKHFTKQKMMVGYAAGKGVPMPGFFVPFSGLLIILGGAGVLLGFHPYKALALIALFLIPVSFKMHAFWNITDPMQKMTEQVQFKKNMALLGAALMLLMVPTPWVMSLVM